MCGQTQLGIDTDPNNKGGRSRCALNGARKSKTSDTILSGKNFQPLMAIRAKHRPTQRTLRELNRWTLPMNPRRSCVLTYAETAWTLQYLPILILASLCAL